MVSNILFSSNLFEIYSLSVFSRWCWMLLCPDWIFDHRTNAEIRILGGFAKICSDFAFYQVDLTLHVNTFNLEELLKVLSPTSHLPIRVWYETTICSSDSIHPRCRLGAELLQGSIIRFKIISIQMTLTIFSATLAILLFISPKKSSCPTIQSPVLVSVSRARGSVYFWEVRHPPAHAQQ